MPPSVDHPVATDAELRAAILAAADGDTITFTGNITLAADLPAVQADVTIDGGHFTLSGNDQFRGLFIGAWQAGTATQVAVSVAVHDLTIDNALAAGGNGGGSGGGGAGLGGAIFVANLATVSLSNVSLTDSQASGGDGAFTGSGGGGGGMGGDGGTDGVGGGGGLGQGADGGTGHAGSAGIATGAASGGSGGLLVGGAGGGGGAGAAAGGGGGFGGGGGVGGGAGAVGGSAGDGGFGGGGGSPSGSGGFGGGGGGASIGTGGFGGFGGGGGGSLPVGGHSVVIEGGFGGGAGGGAGGGGGGAGLGGAIFVQHGGALTLLGPLAVNGNTVAGGSGGGGGAGGGSGFGSGVFLEGQGSVTFSPGAAEIQTISSAIADQAGSLGIISPPVSYSLIKSGAGTLVLGGANTFAGGTSLDAGTIELHNGSALSDKGAVTIADVAGAKLLVSDSETIGSLAGGGTTGGLVEIATGKTLAAGGDGTSTTYDGVIEGDGVLAKSGGGTMTLTAVNTYTGGTHINAGTIAVGDDGALGTGDVTMAEGTTLAFSGSHTIANDIALTGDPTFFVDTGDTDTLSGDITDSSPGPNAGTLEKTGAGNLVLSGNNTYTGPTIVEAGTLTAGAASGFSSDSAFEVASGAVLDVGGFNVTIGSLADVGTTGGTVRDGASVGATLTTGGDGTSTTFSGLIEDGAHVLALVKAGSGNFTLAGTNTYHGGTTINAGIVTVGNNGALGSGTVTMAAGTTLAFSGGYFLANAFKLTGDPTISVGTGFGAILHGIISDADPLHAPGVLEKTGAGGLTLSGASTYSGGTVIAAGTVALQDNSALGTGDVTMAAGTQLAFLGDLTIANNIEIDGDPTFNATLTSFTTINGTITEKGPDAATLEKTGSGTLVLHGASTYTGETIIKEGSLVAGTVAGFSHASAFKLASGAVLNIDQKDVTIGSLADFGGSGGAVASSLPVGSLTTGGDNSSTTFSGTVSVDLTKVGTGTFTFAGASFNQAAIDVSGGKLLLAATGSLANSAVTVETGATFGGNGTAGSVSVHAGGTLAPGASAGTLHTGSLTFTAGAHLAEEIGGAGAGAFDKLVVTGTVDLGGASLAASLLNGFDPGTLALGTAFTLIANDGNDAVTGAFTGHAEGTALALGSGFFRVSYQGGDGNDVTLTAVGPAPTLDLDASSGGNGFTATFVENGPAVAIADVDAAIADPDDTDLESATVTLVNRKPGDLLSVAGILPAGIAASAYDASTGILTLSGSATLAAYATALHRIAFSNTSDTPDTTDRSLAVTVNDGNNDSNIATALIHVAATDDPPAITSDGGGDAAVLSRPENATAVTTVTATDPDSSPLVFSISGGADAAAFVIDAATGALRFIHAPDFEAPADADHDNAYSVTVSVADGSGGADSQALSIEVTNMRGVRIRGTTGDDRIDPHHTVPGQPLPTAEEDHINGGLGDDRLAGGGGNDVIVGCYGDDRLFGGAGDDHLDGRFDHNRLTGGAGDDVFAFSVKVDFHDWQPRADETVITDFHPGEDKIALSRAAFHSLDRVSYDSATGALLFDPEGHGQLAPIEFATLAKHLHLGDGDIILV